MGIGALKVTRLPRWGLAPSQLSLFAVIPLAVEVGISALKVTRLPRWGLAPSELLLFMVIPLQVTRSSAIYGDPAPSDQKYRYFR